MVNGQSSSSGPLARLRVVHGPIATMWASAPNWRIRGFGRRYRAARMCWVPCNRFLDLGLLFRLAGSPQSRIVMAFIEFFCRSMEGRPGSCEMSPGIQCGVL